MSNHPLRETLKPDVPAFIREQASDVEKYLLDMASTQQQRTQQVVETLISVEEQTKLTNGKVIANKASIDALERDSEAALLALDKRVQATEKVAEDAVRMRKWLIACVVLVGPIVYTVINELIQKWITP